MKTSAQPDLFNLHPPVNAPAAPEVEWFVGVLRGRDWITAEDLLRELGQPVDQPKGAESLKRRLRALASASGGRVASSDRGYKLTTEMTAEEFGEFDRRLAGQESEMKRRRLECARVFHSRTNVRRVAEVAG